LPPNAYDVSGKSLSSFGSSSDHVEKSALDYSRVVDQHEQIRGSAVDETGGASVSDPQMEKAFYLHRKDFGALLR